MTTAGQAGRRAGGQAVRRSGGLAVGVGRACFASSLRLSKVGSVIDCLAFRSSARPLARPAARLLAGPPARLPA